MLILFIALLNYLHLSVSFQSTFRQIHSDIHSNLTPKKYRLSIPLAESRQRFQKPPKNDKTLQVLDTAIKFVERNPVYIFCGNIFSFWYWLPRRNLPFDQPWTLFQNSSTEFIAWYQLPNKLPPYDYRVSVTDVYNEAIPDDFFCYGLPGNTLPLGNYDPWFMAQVNKKVVLKYRESELKHGRIAMLACKLKAQISYPIFQIL